MPNWITEKRIELILKMGGKCVRCGFSDIRALQLDHITGLGFLEHKIAKPFTRMIQDLESTERKYQSPAPYLQLGGVICKAY